MKKVIGWVVFTVLAVVIGGFVFVHFSPDYDMCLVRSENIKPAIKMGDMVVIGPLDGPIRGEVKPGSIVTYQYGEELVTHRVLSVDGDTLLTKGDAMEDPDPRLACPPKRSPVLVLDWKIRKGAIDGQEILHTGADYQQAARS